MLVEVRLGVIVNVAVCVGVALAVWVAVADSMAIWAESVASAITVSTAAVIVPSISGIVLGEEMIRAGLNVQAGKRMKLSSNNAMIGINRFFIIKIRDYSSSPDSITE